MKVVEKLFCLQLYGGTIYARRTHDDGAHRFVCAQTKLAASDAMCGKVNECALVNEMYLFALNAPSRIYSLYADRWEENI